MHPSLPSISRTFFHLEKLKLYPFNNNFLCAFAPVLGNHHYTFCLHEFNCSGYFVLSGLLKYLYFCDQLISFNILSSKFKHNVFKMPTSAGSLKKQESSRKTSISDLLTMPKPLTVWITINGGKF